MKETLILAPDDENTQLMINQDGLSVLCATTILSAYWYEIDPYWCYFQPEVLLLDFGFISTVRCFSSKHYTKLKKHLTIIYSTFSDQYNKSITERINVDVFLDAAFIAIKKRFTSTLILEKLQLLNQAVVYKTDQLDSEFHQLTKKILTQRVHADLRYYQEEQDRLGDIEPYLNADIIFLLCYFNHECILEYYLLQLEKLGNPIVGNHTLDIYRNNYRSGLVVGGHIGPTSLFSNSASVSSDLKEILNIMTQFMIDNLITITRHVDMTLSFLLHHESMQCLFDNPDTLIIVAQELGHVDKLSGPTRFIDFLSMFFIHCCVDRSNGIYVPSPILEKMLSMEGSARQHLADYILRRFETTLVHTQFLILWPLASDITQHRVIKGIIANNIASLRYDQLTISDSYTPLAHDRVHVYHNRLHNHDQNAQCALEYKAYESTRLVTQHIIKTAAALERGNWTQFKQEWITFDTKMKTRWLNFMFVHCYAGSFVDNDYFEALSVLIKEAKMFNINLNMTALYNTHFTLKPTVLCRIAFDISDENQRIIAPLICEQLAQVITVLPETIVSSLMHLPDIHPPIELLTLPEISDQTRCHLMKKILHQNIAEGLDACYQSLSLMGDGRCAGVLKKIIDHMYKKIFTDHLTSHHHSSSNQAKFVAFIALFIEKRLEHDQPIEFQTAVLTSMIQNPSDNIFFEEVFSSDHSNRFFTHNETKTCSDPVDFLPVQSTTEKLIIEALDTIQNQTHKMTDVNSNNPHPMSMRVKPFNYK